MKLPSPRLLLLPFILVILFFSTALFAHAILPVALLDMLFLGNGSMTVDSFKEFDAFALKMLKICGL